MGKGIGRAQSYEDGGASRQAVCAGAWLGVGGGCMSRLHEEGHRCMRQATCEQQAAALESREASRWQQASTGRAAVHDAAAANINCQLTGTQLFQASENVNHLFEFKKGCFEFRKGGGSEQLTARPATPPAKGGSCREIAQARAYACTVPASLFCHTRFPLYNTASGTLTAATTSLFCRFL